MINLLLVGAYNAMASTWIDTTVVEMAIDNLAATEAEEEFLHYQLSSAFDCDRFGNLCDEVDATIAEEAVREVVWRAAEGWPTILLSDIFRAHIMAYNQSGTTDGFAYVGSVAVVWGDVSMQDVHVYTGITDSTGNTCDAEVTLGETHSSPMMALLGTIIFSGCPSPHEEGLDNGFPGRETESETETEGDDSSNGSDGDTSSDSEGDESDDDSSSE